MATEDQPWFWGDAEKATVSERLANERDGTFIIRNASQPGQFTLSVRCDGQTRLARILFVDGYCGFVEDDLRFQSVSELVEFHRDTSLKIYNKHLDTPLLYPLTRPNYRPPANRVSSIFKKYNDDRRSIPSPHTLSSGPSTSSMNSFPAKDPEWEHRLDLERLRIAQTALDRSTRLYETAVQDTQKAENLHHSFTKSIAELDRKITELSEILETQVAISNDESADKGTVGALSTNRLIIKNSVNRISEEKACVLQRRSKLLEIMNQLMEEQTAAKKRLVADQGERNRAYQDLIEQKVPRSKLDATVLHAAEMLSKEELALSYRLADLPLLWEPKRYLVNEASKEYAATLINNARKRQVTAEPSSSTDGIFLIRPSASHADKLVLSVLCGDKLSHCLIEHIEQGWGFASCNMYFVTIGDFVRYYASESLHEHNADIRTCLTYPAII